MTSNHEKFHAHLRDSEPARWRAARWLVRRGYTVWIPPMQIAPSADQWPEYADNGDLFIRMRVEVKHRKLDFTCASDFPHREGLFLMERSAFDRAEPKPYGFIILNRACTHAGFVLSSTSPSWAVVRHGDSRYGGDYSQETYRAPLDVVTFGELEQQS